MNKAARGALGSGAGVVLIASSALHALLGWPAMRAALDDAGAGAPLVGALAAGWLFGSVSMLAFGCIVLSDGLDAARGRPVATRPLWIIAAAYLLFGIAALVARGANPHFLLFVVTGLLVGGFAATLR